MLLTFLIRDAWWIGDLAGSAVHTGAK